MHGIGKKIKELRLKNDMTQEKLADYLGVSYQSVSKWETGITSPDLSLIVPIARLFKVTTDELFDFNESAEESRRADLKRRYDETFKTGDIKVRFEVCEEAVREYPGDMKWLNDHAWAVWCDALSIPDDAEYSAQREKAIAEFRKVIENCDNDEIKGNAIVGIVECLNGKGAHDEARQYAELYPDTQISADEKRSLIISCLTGEEKVVKSQERLLNKFEELLNNILFGECGAEKRAFAETIIKLFIPDGNYLTFHHHLYMICLSEAREEIRDGDYDKAVCAMRKAREHAIALDKIKGEYLFTAPLFNKVKFNTDEWYKTGTGTQLDDFIALFDFPAYSPLKAHKDYEKLISRNSLE